MTLIYTKSDYERYLMLTMGVAVEILKVEYIPETMEYWILSLKNGEIYIDYKEFQEFMQSHTVN